MSVHEPVRNAPPGEGATPAKTSATIRCSQPSTLTAAAPPRGQCLRELGLLVDERQHPRRLAVGHQQRRHRQPGPVGTASGGQHRDRRREPAAQPADRAPLVVGRQERVVGVDRHAAILPSR